MPRLDATDLRKRLYDVLRHVRSEGPVEVCRNGRVEAVISPSPDVSDKPKYDPRRLSRICQRHGVARLALFGSVVRDDFGPTSDVDVLYELLPGKKKTLAGYLSLADALSDLFGRPVDLHHFDTLESCSNKYLRLSILEDSNVIYEAR